MQYLLSILPAEKKSSFATLHDDRGLSRRNLFLAKHFNHSMETQARQASLLDSKLRHCGSVCEGLSMNLNAKFSQKNDRDSTDVNDQSPFICFQNLTETLGWSNVSYPASTVHQFDCKSPTLIAKGSERELARLENASRIASLISLSLGAKEAALASEIEFLENFLNGQSISRTVVCDETAKLEASCNSMYKECTNLVKRISSNDYLQVNLRRRKQRREYQLSYLASLDRKIALAKQSRARHLIIRDLLIFEDANFLQLSSALDKITCNLEKYCSLTSELSLRFHLGTAKMNTFNSSRQILPVLSDRNSLAIEKKIRHLLSQIRIVSSVTSPDDPSETWNNSDAELVSSLDREISFLSSKSSIANTCMKDFAEVAKKMSQLLLMTVRDLDSPEEFSSKTPTEIHPTYWTSLSSFSNIIPTHLIERIVKVRSKIEEVDSQILKLTTSFELHDTL